MMLRRTLLFAGGAAAVGMAVPLVQNGMKSFLNRVLRTHFGDDVMQIAGLEDFVTEYAATVGRDDLKKRTGANVYFAMRGDRIKKVGIAQDLEQRFLQTILTRSNIIAVRQGRVDAFDYTDADPWALVCGGYLTAAADTMS